MTLASAPFHAAQDALRAAISFAAPADAVLSRFFRDNPKLGSHDRAFVAEAVFGVLRHKRALDAICVEVRAIDRGIRLLTPRFRQ